MDQKSILRKDKSLLEQVKVLSKQEISKQIKGEHQLIRIKAAVTICLWMTDYLIFMTF